MQTIKRYSEFTAEAVKDWLLAGALSAAAMKSSAGAIHDPARVTRTDQRDKDVVFPDYVTGEYTVRPGDCDALHAFQSRKVKDKQGNVISELIGNMHVLVSDRLKELHRAGHNVKATEVDVQVTGTTVRWSVKIEESNDGRSWVGFTSRGAGCSNDVATRSVSGGNSMDSVQANVRRVYNEPRSEIEMVDETLYKHPTYGFRQVFYAYTMPESFPANRTARLPAAKAATPTRALPAAQARASSQEVYSRELDFAPGVLNAVHGFYRGKFEVGLQARLDSFDISYDASRKKIRTSMTVTPDPTSEWFNFVFVSGPLGDNSSRDRVISANKEYDPKVLRSGTLVLPDGRYGWSLIGLRK